MFRGKLFLVKKRNKDKKKEKKNGVLVLSPHQNGEYKV